jgi:hypothetical protein
VRVDSESELESEELVEVLLPCLRVPVLTREGPAPDTAGDTPARPTCDGVGRGIGGPVGVKSHGSSLPAERTIGGLGDGGSCADRDWGMLSYRVDAPPKPRYPMAAGGACGCCRGIGIGLSASDGLRKFPRCWSRVEEGDDVFSTMLEVGRDYVCVILRDGGK